MTKNTAETVGTNVNLFKKLLEVRKSVPYLQKSEKGHQYSYVGSSGVLAALRDKLDEKGLLLFPKVIDNKMTLISVENVDKYGNKKVQSKVFTELNLLFTWVDSETGESFEVPFYAQGYDIEGEKGVGKALTYGEKYFLLKQFNIATDSEDPDSFQQKNEQATPNYISSEQAKELLGYASEFASLRNVPVDSVIQELNLGIKTFDRLYVANYKAVRDNLLNWLNRAKEKMMEQQQPVMQQQQQQQHYQQPMMQSMEQGYEQQQMMEQHYQQQMMEQPPQQYQQSQGQFPLYLINKIEQGVTNNGAGVPYGKLFVTDIANGSQFCAVAKQEVIGLLANLVEGNQYPLNIENQAGLYFLVGVGQ